MATLKYLLDVSAPDAQKTFDAVGTRLADLDRSLNRTRELGIGDASAKATLTRLQLQADKFGKSLKGMDLTIEGAAKAESQLLGLEATADRLNKKLDSKDSVFGKIAGSAAVAPSVGGSLLALSPAAIPLLAGVTAGTVALGVSLTAAAGGAAAFGLLAEQAFTGAATAATAVNVAQNTYNASIAAGTKKATAYRTEQKAINLAYAEMTPAQIQLSKTIGDLQDAWQGVQQATTPLITGALVPWIRDVTGLLKYITPIVTPVAVVFRDWGQSLGRLIASAPSSEISKLAAAFGRFSATQLRDIGTFIGDIAAGIFSLGKDLAGAGANLGTAGVSLSAMGAGFLTWSKSTAARKDVQGFLHFLHTEGPVVGSILKDLVKYIPGIFAGATTAGTLELKALSDLLGLIAKLPPSWAKPLTEAAGALLLLAKTGVLKIGFTVVGAAASWIKKLISGASVDLGGDAAAAAMRAAMISGGTAAAAEMRAAMTGAGTTAAGEEATAGAAFGKTAGAGLSGLAGPIGIGIAAGFLANAGLNKVLPKSVNNLRTPFTVTGVFDNLTTGGAAAIGDALVKGIELPAKTAIRAYDALVSGVKTDNSAIANAFDQMRHHTATVFDGMRHDIASAWDLIWGNTIGRIQAGDAAASHGFDILLHDIADIYDSIRHGIASSWDTIWNNTVTRVKSGIDDVVNWFKSMPARLIDALRGIGSAMYSEGHYILTEMWNGLKSVAGSIGSWFASFGHTVISIVKKVLGVFSPSSVFYDIGKNLMLGLRNGIIDHAKTAVTAAQGTAHQVMNAGAGVQRWAGLVRQALAMEGLSPSLLGNVLYQMQTESGGNPNAINLTDSNAAAGDPSRGLMQTIMSTFDSYHWPGTSYNIYDPLANIAAALNYARHVYGPSLERGGMGIGSGHGYAAGSWNVPWTGPATVHRGEMIIPQRQAAAIRSGASGGGALVNVQGNLVIRERADAGRLARDLAFQITAAGMGR